jgi:hypothetical protein
MWGYNVASSTGEGTYGVYTAPDGRRAHLNNPWTNALGKICPGPGKIREYPDLLAAVARRVAGGPDTPTRRRKVFRDIVDEKGNRFLSDGQTIRWMRNAAAVAYGHSLAVDAGNPSVLTATAAQIKGGTFGAYIDNSGVYPGESESLHADVRFSADALLQATLSKNAAVEAAKVAGETKELVENLQVGGGTVDVAAIAEAVADEQARRMGE